MQRSPLPFALHAPLHAAFDSVTRHGRHISSAIEEIFRAVAPEAELAELVRATLIHAIRTGDLQGALQGTPPVPIDHTMVYLPAWLGGRLRTSLGDCITAFLEASVTDAPTFIRVNTLKTSVDACVQALAPYQPHAMAHEAVRVDRPFGLFRSEPFQAGWFEQQDVTSQRIARCLDPAPGMRVVDSCAGAGGKSLHLAALMGNRGRIIAMDVVADKLDACRQRASRAGADIIETRLIDTTKVVKRQAGTADRVLIDAPCTGTGVLRRNPDIPWHLTERGFAELCDTQASLLRLHSRMLAPGGRLVYATCSVLKEEGPDQVRAFLAEHSEFSCIEEWSTMPGEDGGDGFYAATLTRSDAS